MRLYNNNNNKKQMNTQITPLEIPLKERQHNFLLERQQMEFTTQLEWYIGRH